MHIISYEYNISTNPYSQYSTATSLLRYSGELDIPGSGLVDDEGEVAGEGAWVDGAAALVAVVEVVHAIRQHQL